jgi:Domain of unknown function (DUF4276)
MSGVAIYMEGGGDGHGSRAALRQGMDVFLTPLKQAARARSWRWKLVCCGGREEAFRAFVHALRGGEMTLTVLLVDAEGPVATSPRAHLQSRDGWDLSGIGCEIVHLMIQAMETWIVADLPALRGYYGQYFNATPLPRALNLEDVKKSEIANALQQATRATQKGAYHKIRHAGDLLKQIDVQSVKKRCPSCIRLFDTLGAAIAKA